MIFYISILGQSQKHLGQSQEQEAEPEIPKSLQLLQQASPTRDYQAKLRGIHQKTRAN